MPSIRRLSFIGLEYVFAPEKAYGMSRGGGNRRQGGLVEIETDQGVKGIGEAFGNPFVTREYFRMIEPMFVGKSVFDFEHIEARIRNSMYHLGVGNQLTAALAAINVALYDAIARGFGVRVCDLIGGCGTTRIPAYASTGFFSDDPDRQLVSYAGRSGGPSLCRRQDQDRPRHQERRRAGAPEPRGARPRQAAAGRYQRRLHARRGAGVRAGHRAVRHPLDRGAAAAGRPARLCRAAGAFADPAGGRRGASHGAGFPRTDRRPLHRHRAAFDPDRRRPDRGQARRDPCPGGQPAGRAACLGRGGRAGDGPAFHCGAAARAAHRRTRRGRRCSNTT